MKNQIELRNEVFELAKKGMLITIIAAIITLLVPAFLLGPLAIALLIPLFILTIVSYFNLKVDRGEEKNRRNFYLFCSLIGLSAGYSMQCIIYWVGFYASEPGFLTIVIQAIVIALFLTITCVYFTIRYLPNLINSEGKIQFLEKFKAIAGIVFITLAIAYLISFILLILGISSPLTVLMELFYSAGPISIMFSIFTVICVEVLFISNLRKVRDKIIEDEAVGPEFKYYGAAMIVNSIVDLYLEIFRLILQILVNIAEEA